MQFTVRLEWFNSTNGPWIVKKISTNIWSLAKSHHSFPLKLWTPLLRVIVLVSMVHQNLTIEWKESHVRFSFPGSLTIMEAGFNTYCCCPREFYKEFLMVHRNLTIEWKKTPYPVIPFPQPWHKVFQSPPRSQNCLNLAHARGMISWLESYGRQVEEIKSRISECWDRRSGRTLRTCEVITFFCLPQ